MNQPPVRVVADIGGTNARFAQLDEKGQFQQVLTLPTGDYPGLSEALASYLYQSSLASVQQLAVAVANPVTGDFLTLTNTPWSFSIRAIRHEWALQRFEVVNDFTALAMSLPRLHEDDLIQVGPGRALARRTCAVIGPGTGLGVSGIVPCEQDGWEPLQGEGGHVSLGVRSVQEAAVREVLATRFQHVSAERVLSGPGLVNLHDALREIDGLPEIARTPADITHLGLARKDTVCVETLMMFCALLGSCAGNLALTLGAEGGVYVGGGIVPRLGAFFIESDFRAEFEAKGRLQPYLAGIPTFVIQAPYPALRGVSECLLRA